jgi:diaminohydroxyphosphoribosylaminopyrimidine deaminase/5-amino-6-(5-phosphoribosylamino)uracil reductase
VTLKLALSADGRLGRRRGRVEDPEARRITGPAVWRRVQRLRASARAVLVGRGTVEADRPRLDVRHFRPQRAPRTVVLDTEGRLDPRLLPPRALVLSAAAGEVAGCPPGPGGLAWTGVLEALRRLELDSVLVEGGARVASSLLAVAPPQRVHLFLAPRFLGAEGPAITEYLGREHEYSTVRVGRVGEDIEWILRRGDLPSPATLTDIT